MTPSANSPRTIMVWDPLVRLFHWSLVAAFTLAWLVDDESRAHVLAGYTVGGLVLFRILWGFIGTRHARFADFLYSPAATLGYARDLLAHRERRTLGHNPLGGWMVIALLVALAFTVFTGLKLEAAEGRGPLAEAPALIATAQANGDDDDEEGDEDEFWEDLHEVAANTTLLLVILHIGGVLATSLRHRENLTRSMITGRKRE